MITYLLDGCIFCISVTKRGENHFISQEKFHGFPKSLTSWCAQRKTMTKERYFVAMFTSEQFAIFKKDMLNDKNLEKTITYTCITSNINILNCYINEDNE